MLATLSQTIDCLVAGVDAITILAVASLLTNDAGGGRRPSRAMEPPQIGAHASCSQTRTSGSTRGPISLSTRA